MRACFLWLWLASTCAKLLLAWRLPLFVDEAFYAWESRRLAWAYSDLPGLSAWLAHLGLATGGEHAFALRLPFVLLASALPWLVRRLAALRERVHAVALFELAFALALGALAHYRFAMVLLAGALGLLLDPRARRLLREPALWAVLAFGALAWWPLLHWNLEHAAAGLRFQLVERNPWRFHADGLAWLPIQFLLVTPGLFVLLLAVARRAWRQRGDAQLGWGLLAAIATLCVAGWFVLGFFADSERVSFHWPLAGWLALACAAPRLLDGWPRFARALVWGGAALGTAIVFAFLAAACVPQAREALAGTRLYPDEFGGWQEAGAWARSAVDDDAMVVASDFELGAELAFALGRDDVRVLDNPLNAKHGRAVQLRAWGLQLDAAPSRPAWFVLDDDALRMRFRLPQYHRDCALFGALPPPRVLSVDHGRKRYFLYRYEPARARAGCSAPALAYIDAPMPGATVPANFAVSGWAFEDDAGIARIEVVLDGKPAALASYGDARPEVAAFWQVSSDRAHPRVGLHAQVDASRLRAGVHWLGLRLHGRDGSVEDWPEQEVRIEARSGR